MDNLFSCAYAQLSMMSPHNFNLSQFQDFEYFVVIDFEATCDNEKNHQPRPQEIIEFPSVIVRSMTADIEASFQTYVKPKFNPQLSDFCKDLTGIQQIQVDKGVTLDEALLMHDRWLETMGVKNTNFAVVTWSNWDCGVMLESECCCKNIRKPPYFNRWINLRVPFLQVFGSCPSLKEAVEKAGLVWRGRPHCGLDDAKNAAGLLTLLMRKGFRFSITDHCFTTKASFPFYQHQTVWTLQVPPPVPLQPHCYCGVKSKTGMVRKPGPKQGSVFFGCGNWTRGRGACCNYFQWISPQL